MVRPKTLLIQESLRRAFEPELLNKKEQVLVSEEALLFFGKVVSNIYLNSRHSLMALRTIPIDITSTDMA